MKRSSGGYSLVEVLVAMTILVIAVMPMFGTYPKLMQSTQRSVETEEGGRLASTVVEYIKGIGYTKLFAKLPTSGSSYFNVNYTLEKIPDSNTYKCEAFSNEFNYTDSTITDSNKRDFFLLNSKFGLNLGTAKINVVMDRARVRLRATTGSALDDVNDPIIYNNFIIGKVQVESSNASLKKEIRFVVTPIEE